MTIDNLDSMSVDNVSSQPLSPELGISPSSLQTIGPAMFGGGNERRYGEWREQAQASMIAGRDHDWTAAMTAARAAGKRADCVALKATDPLYVLYTSGTTGIPKGVVRDNGGHMVALKWTMKNLSGIDPTTRTITELFRPRQQIWREHFEWNGATLVGKSPTGRATIQVLNINRADTVSVRRLLMQEGVYPSD
jgi:acyl-CoA synthetase (AMP-forming)/AMP-acid ligase II